MPLISIPGDLDDPVDPADTVESVESVVPGAADRHLLSRFSWGITAALTAESNLLGGAQAWFESQLVPWRDEDPAAVVDSWWPHLRWSAQRKLALDLAGERLGFEQDADFVRWTLVRRTRTTRQVHDLVVDLWSNLLYVGCTQRSTFPHRAAYDQTIRANALGSYEQLLTSAVLHPCMLWYLDNARSTRDAPNENLGRELLEIHTVGRDAGYTEDDVRDSTRILTGYRVEPDGRCEPYYSPEDHDTGRVRVLGFSHENTDPDGRTVAEAYLAYLAQHPETARRVAHRLAVRFVSDDPPAGLVDDLTETYLRNRSAVVPVLQRLVRHPDFAASAGRKVRTPSEDLTATLIALQTQVRRPSGSGDGLADTIVVAAAEMGQRPFSWPRPDGFPDVADAWTSASRVLGSWRVHRNLAAAAAPDLAPPADWLPKLPARFEDVVDELCRMLLARKAAPAHLDGACLAVGLDPESEVDAGSACFSTRFVPLLQSVLDTADHMTR